MKIDIEYQVIQIRLHTWAVLTSFECSGPCHGLITLLTGKLSTIEIIRSFKVTHGGIYYSFLSNAQWNAPCPPVFCSVMLWNLY